MSYCIVRDCRNSMYPRGNSKRQIEEKQYGEISYHQFPRDPYKRKVWLAGLGLLNWEPPETAIVCSYHFTEDDFVNCTTKRYLKETAIPTSESMPNEPVNNVSPVSEDANSTYSKHFSTSVTASRPHNLENIYVESMNDSSSVSEDSRSTYLEPKLDSVTSFTTSGLYNTLGKQRVRDAGKREVSMLHRQLCTSQQEKAYYKKRIKALETTLRALKKQKLDNLSEWNEHLLNRQIRNNRKNPTKKQRHLCNKRGTSDDESISSDDSNAERSRKRHKQQHMPSHNNKIVPAKKNLFDENKKSSSKQIINNPREKLALNNNTDILKEVLNIQEYAASGYAFSDDEMSHDDGMENINNSFTIEMMDKMRVVLKENKRLKAENAKLLTLQCRCCTLLDSNIYKMKDVTAAILENLHKIQQEMDICTNTSTRKHTNTNIDINNTNINDVSNTSRNIPHNEIKEKTNSRNLLLFAPKANTTTATLTAKEFVSIPIKSENCDNTENTTTLQSATINFGGRNIDVEKINRINKLKGISAYTSALMNVVFTSQEMATSTMTGTISNFNKNKMQRDDQQNKKQELNPLVRDAVIDFIMKEFDISDKCSLAYLKLKNAMKVKLNNEATYMKKRTTM